MTDQIEEAVARRLASAANPLDDSDWLDVRRRARRIAPERGRRRFLARRMRLPVAAGAVASAAVLTWLIGSLPGSDRTTDAVRVLDAAAATAAAQPPSAPGRGEYTYVQQRSGVIAHGGAIARCADRRVRLPQQLPSGGREAEVSSTTEWWVAADGSGRMRQSGAQGGVVVEQSRGGGAVDATVLGTSRCGVRDVRFGPGGFTQLYKAQAGNPLAARVDELPTDPQAVERVLRREPRDWVDYNPDPGVESIGLLQIIGDILANPLASPELRSALYEVAGRLDGVEIRKDARDPIGRPGTAIVLGGEELIFDPATSATLGSRQVSGAIEGYTVYLEQGKVDSTSKRP